MPNATLHVALAVAFAVVALPAQRRIPAARDPLGSNHLLIAPANVRGTTFYLGMTEDHEALWNRFEDSKASVEFRLAQMARVGVNDVRLWSSYRAYLRARYCESPSLTNGHWDRVNEFLTMAHDYEIGTDLVLFNAAGYIGGPGEQIHLSSPHDPTGTIVQADDNKVDVTMPRAVLPGGIISQASGQPDWFRVWVGSPLEYSPGAKNDFIRLYRHKEYPGQSYPGSFLDTGTAARTDFAWDHLLRMNSAGVSTNKGLSTLQVCNEPPTFGTAFYEVNPTTFYGVDGNTWGDVCFRIFNMLQGGTGSPTNPHSVGRTFGFKSLNDISYRKNDNSGYWAFDPPATRREDMLWTGFGPSSQPPPPGDHPIKQLDRWVMHSSADAHVHINEPAQHTAKDAKTLEGQFFYINNDIVRTPTTFLQDLATHWYVGDTFPNPTKVTFQSTVAEEAQCRTGTLQAATDFVYHTVPDGRWNQDGKTRLGLNAWSLYASDASKADFGPLFLACNYCIAPNDQEAFLDNWRRDTTRFKPPSLAPHVIAGDDGTNTANAMSDAIQMDMATSPDRKVVVVVWADNFDPRVGHADYRGAPPSASGYPHAHKLFYRVGVGPGDGTYTWWPGNWDSAAAVLDQSPGPLVFDDTRAALSSVSQWNTTANVNLPDPLFQEVDGSPTGHNATCCGTVPPAVNAGHYSLIEHGEGVLGGYSVLRRDVMHWLKMRNPDVDLHPSIVFRKQSGDEYEFFVAWSRPVKKTGTGISNPGEKYYPEEDNHQTNASGGYKHQQYFVPFRNSIDKSGTEWNYLKNEVLTAAVRIDRTNVGATPPVVSVLTTRGTLGESAIANGNMQMVHAPTLNDPGAAAIYPRLFASPEGHVAVVYLKAQDSWFDVSTPAPACGLCAGWATWLANSRFHLYPWEMHCQVFLAGSGLAGSWLASELPISESYPGGTAAWRDALEARLPAIITQKRTRVADFFPAVDPAGVLWQQGDALELRVSFKELISWFRPDELLYPHGYETMVHGWRINNLSGTPSAQDLLVKRMRVPAPSAMPLEPGEEPPPDHFACKEILFDTGEGAILRTPEFGGMGVTAIAQHGNMLKANTDAASGGQESVATTVEHYLGDYRVFATDFKAASVEIAGPKRIAMIAFLYLHPASQATGRITPEVSLRVWSRLSPGGAQPEETLEIRETTQNAPGGDLQAKVLGLSDLGDDGTGTKRMFSAVWSQSGRIFRQKLSVHKTTGALVREGGLLSEAGTNSADTDADFLHNGKLKAKADAFGVTFTTGRWVHYKAFAP